MAETFEQILSSINNSQLRESLAKLFAITGVGTGSSVGSGGGELVADLTGDVEGDLTGNSAGVHTGAVTGNVSGDVTGSIDGAVVDGDTLITKTLTPVNAVAAVDTLTFTTSMKHGESFVIGTETFDIHGDNVTAYAGANTEVDITAAATAAQASEILTLDGDCVEGETVTIGSDIYELDSDGDVTASNIPVDISGDMTNSAGTVTVNTILAAGDTITLDAVVYTLMADNTAASPGEVDVGSDLADGKVNLTAAFAGTDGWNTAHPTCSQAAWATHDWVITYNIGGTEGDLIDFLSDSTEGTNSIDGAGTLGATVAGVDCAKADAQTALAAQVAISGLLASQPYSFADVWGSDSDTLTMHNVGVEGNGEAHEETGANMAWTGGDGVTDGGVDGTPTEHEVIFAALTPAAAVTLAAAAGTAITCTSDVAGVVGNAIVATEALTGTAWGDGSTLVGGVDGTVGSKGQIEWDASYIYVCVLANTIADGNWERAGISSY
jgi:hypothetical protein